MIAYFRSFHRHLSWSTFLIRTNETYSQSSITHPLIILACVASVTNRAIVGKLEQELKKGIFFALVPTFSTNSHGNACYTGYHYLCNRLNQWRIQGRDPGGSAHPYFWTKLRSEGPKKFFIRPGRPLISGSGWPPPPPLIWRSGSATVNSVLVSFRGTQRLLSVKYRKIPKISPGAYIFQRAFLRGLFLEGPITHSLTHTHLVARRRATTRSFHSLLSAISTAISLAPNAPVSL